MEEVVSYKYPSIAKGKGTGRNWAGNNNGWVIEEKMDGSQLTFQNNGETVHFYNRGTEKFAPYDMMFDRAIAAIKTMVDKLHVGYIYHGEVICRRRHNVVHYDRVPRFNFIMFDLQMRSGQYLPHQVMIEEANRIGFEYVPALWDNIQDGNDETSPNTKIDEFIQAIESGELQSCLGGRSEGVVLKHPLYLKEYTMPSGEIKTKMVATKMKSVCQIFKEHQKTKKEKLLPMEPGAVVEQIISWYPQEPWWRKAYQRLRDQGVIHEGDPLEQRNKDGGKIAGEVRRDFLEENEEQIKELLWAAFGLTIAKGVATGASQWYRGPDPDDPDYDPNWSEQYDVQQPWMPKK
jgi:RNA ligase